MSYPWIGLIGAVTGWVVGRYGTGSRQHMAVDAIGGAIGAWLLVVLARVVVPETGRGSIVSAIVAIAGAIVMLFVMNRFMRATVISLPRSRRRM